MAFKVVSSWACPGLKLSGVDMKLLSFVVVFSGFIPPCVPTSMRCFRGGGGGGDFPADDDFHAADGEGGSGLLAAPGRRVDQINVPYARTAKQVGAQHQDRAVALQQPE